MAQDVIELITSDHREVERLFDQLKAGQGNSSALLEEVGRLLIAHNRAEEERVYPVVAREASDEKGQVRHSQEEHEQAEELLRQLQETDPAEEQFATLVEQLVEAVTHHVETEESEVLPALREAVDERRLEELGQEFSRRRQEVMEEAESRVRSAEQPSREDLYREAQDADIPGRSQMNEEELADAVRDEANEE